MVFKHRYNKVRVHAWYELRHMRKWSAGSANERGRKRDDDNKEDNHKVRRITSKIIFMDR